MSSSVHEFSHLPRSDHAVAAEKGMGAPEVLAAGRGDEPCVGVIYNPRSHRNRGQDLDCGTSPHIFVAQPGNRDQLPAALKDFAERKVDLLIINGGDGTVRDVLTSGQAIFGDNWPAIAVLPKGKTNALTVDLDAPSDWSIPAAVAAFRDGRRIVRAPMVIQPTVDPDACVLGFILGAGAFTLGTQAGQSAHKLGAFNSLAVGVTAAWGVLQAVFGSRQNPWRRGVEMELHLKPGGAALAHSGQGDPKRRQLLFASTLERMPAGIKPFGHLQKGLKLAVLDQITRRTTALLPFIVAGWTPKDLRERGFHRVVASGFTMELDEPFILDGEAFPAGRYEVSTGPELSFVAPPA
ncbi:diacylglycerol/lipid kinase family protein [Altererythrobacter sp. GH1-8]|uniref:diacylglycerol/lipid kinase family protein n=1 Tax=Altererythrobacter sp. GH1-8 TaxID=3349333 RepID=UPI00374DCCE8